jgi:modulator of FtsH protease HflC
MKSFFKWLLRAAAAALLVYLTTFQVDESEVAIVMRLGKPDREVGPGLHFKLPTPMDTVLRIDRRMHVLDPDSKEILTRDKQNTVVDAFVAWRVADVALFARAVRGSVADAEIRLTDKLRSIVLDVIAVQDLSSLISVEPGQTTLTEISAQITERMQREARKDFGIDVPLAVIKRVGVPGQNKNSIYSRMEADRKALARGYRSEGEEEYQKIQARTDRQTDELIAQANQKAAEIKAKTDADVQRIFAEAAAKDPELWSLLQQIELQEGALGSRTTLVLPDDSPLLQLLKAQPGK